MCVCMNVGMYRCTYVYMNIQCMKVQNSFKIVLRYEERNDLPQCCCDHSVKIAFMSKD